MAKVDRSEPTGTLPRLREEFEASRALVQRARERARRAVESAQAMRLLLQARHGTRDGPQPAVRSIWDAAAQEIQRLSQDRDRAFGMLAHELRQPLAAAITAERLLAVSTDPALQARARGVLERQLLHLSKLIDSLLDYSRLTLHSVSIAGSTIDLHDALMQAIERAEPIAASRSQRLAVRFASLVPLVQGDLTRLVQVFSNLLLNAVRYTPPGGQISVSTHVDGSIVRIAVSDTGPGLTPEQRLVLFEPFTRGSTEGAGLGIGLALARRIVELHSGEIVAQSEGAGMGSTFVVTLPLLRNGG